MNITSIRALRALGVAAALLGASAAHAYEMYWTNWSAGGDIYRGNTDGTGTTLIVDGSAATSGIAVDQTGGRIYWGESGGLIRSAKLDGSDVQTVVATGASTVWNLDVSGGTVYFNSTGTVGSQGVGRVNTDGSGLSFLGTGANGEGLDFDPVSGSVYYQSFSGNWPLNTIPGGGGVYSTIIDSTAGYSNFVPGIEVDAVNGYLYFTDANASGNLIKRVNLDGTGLTTIANVTGSSRIYTLELDLANNQIYYGNFGGEFGVVGLDGSGDTLLFKAPNSVYAMDILIPVLDGGNGRVPAPAPLALLLPGLLAIVVARRR